MQQTKTSLTYQCLSMNLPICKNIYTSIFCNIFVMWGTNIFTEVAIMMPFSYSCSSKEETYRTYFSFWFLFSFLLEALNFIYHLVCTNLAFPVQLSLSPPTNFLTFLLFSPHLTGKGSGKEALSWLSARVNSPPPLKKKKIWFLNFFFLPWTYCRK